MSNFKVFIFIFATSLLVVIGCRKDTVHFTPYPIAIEEIKSLLKQIPPATYQNTKTFSNPTNNISMITPQNSRIMLDASTTLFLNSQGETVSLSNCNEAKIILHEYVSKSALVAKTFSLKQANSPAKSTGVVYVECTCDGNQLSLAPGEKITVQIVDKQNELNPNYQMFTGTLGATDSISNWTDMGQPVYLAKFPISVTDTLNMYSFETEKLGWITGMQPIINPTVDFCVTLEDFYLPQNTAIYLLFDAYKSIINMTYDENLKQFCAKGVPNDSEVQIILVSKIGDDWKMSSTSANTSSGGSNITLQPMNTTKENIISEFRFFD